MAWHGGNGYIKKLISHPADVGRQRLGTTDAGEWHTHRLTGFESPSYVRTLYP